ARGISLMHERIPREGLPPPQQVQQQLPQRIQQPTPRTQPLLPPMPVMPASLREVSTEIPMKQVRTKELPDIPPKPIQQRQPINIQNMAAYPSPYEEDDTSNPMEEGFPEPPASPPRFESPME
ncbi:MAG: hypothetical protein KKB31_01280, partial [Nanoarchaeota archaeon]|nr:hypothetical protein [Nanoarchaeota archaeon]